MYVNLALIGSVIASKRYEITDLILINTGSSSSIDMLNDSYHTADGSDEIEEIPNPPPQGSISLYRHWLSLIFGSGGTTPSSGPYTMRAAHDGWVVIDQIKREDPVFDDIWNPEVSGDWSEYLPRPLERTRSDLSAASGDTSSWAKRVDLSGRGSLLRWAFKTEDFDPTQRDFDRLYIWKKAADTLRTASFISYLEAVVAEIPESVVDAISRDVPRTNPPELHPRMTRVLHAYAARNPTVGFCQGMSYIVSSLLQNEWVTDEDAFNILSALIEGVNLDYYDNGLSGLHADIRRLEKFMFYKDSEQLSVPIELVLVEPMMCLFTRLVPLESALRMIDIALTHGRVGLFPIYLAAIELVNPELNQAVKEADSPSGALVDGAVAFKLGLVRLLTEECDSLIRRAEGFLLTYRSELEELINNDSSAELVFSSNTQPSQPAGPVQFLNRLRAAMNYLFEDPDVDW